MDGDIFKEFNNRNSILIYVLCDLEISSVLALFLFDTIPEKSNPNHLNF